MNWRSVAKWGFAVNRMPSKRRFSRLPEAGPRTPHRLSHFAKKNGATCYEHYCITCSCRYWRRLLRWTGRHKHYHDLAGACMVCARLVLPACRTGSKAMDLKMVSGRVATPSLVLHTVGNCGCVTSRGCEDSYSWVMFTFILLGT